MNEDNKPMFIGVSTVQNDLGVSRSKAYGIIRQLNAEMKEQNPTALVVAGRLNRIWYEEACLQRGYAKNGCV